MKNSRRCAGILLCAPLLMVGGCSGGETQSAERTTLVVTVTQEAPEAEAPSGTVTSTVQVAAGPSAEERCREPYMKPHAPTAKSYFCDGRWLMTMVPYTDDYVFRYWDGTQWRKPQKMGETTSPGMMMPCYSRETLDALAPIPPEIKLHECKPGEYRPV